MFDFSAVKERIRDRVDLVDLIAEHTPLTRRGRNLIGLCPFHQEKTPSFSVDSERQFFKCFGCGAGGDVFSFVQRRDAVDFPEALRILADRAGIELTPSDAPARVGASTRADIARVNLWAAQFFARRLKDARIGESTRAYLDGRGISTESIDRFGLGLAVGGFDTLLKAADSARIDRRLLIDAGLCKSNPNGSIYDTFRDRLMFPIRDTSGRHLGFGGRTLVNDDAKYLNTPETPLFCKRKSLYGLDLARESIVSDRTAVLVEGYTDCIACHQHGCRNVLATLGTAVTDDHMNVLRRYCDTVILVLDADVAGAAAAERGLGIGLKHGLTVRLASTNGAKDPCDFLQTSGIKEFTALLNSAEDALGFQWRRTRQRYDGGESPAIKRQVATAFVSQVAEWSHFGAIDAIQQGIIVGQLANMLELPAERVRGLLYDRARRVRPQAVEAAAPRPSRPRSAEQAALVEILRLVLAQPGLYAQLGGEFDAERFEEPAFRRIAGHLRVMATKRGGFTLADLLVRLTDAHEADLVTDLATEGSVLAADAVEAAFSSSVARLRECVENRETHRLTALCRQSAAGDSKADDSEKREQLALVGRRLAGRRGFSHARAINEFGRAE